MFVMLRVKFVSHVHYQINLVTYHLLGVDTLETRHPDFWIQSCVIDVCDDGWWLVIGRSH